MSLGRRGSEQNELLRCMRDLTVLSALQGVWNTSRAPEVVESIAAALMPLLDAELIYVRLRDPEDGARVEHVHTRLGPAPGMLVEVRRTLDDWLPENGLDPLSPVTHPFGAGRLNVASARIGSEKTGVIVACSSDPAFPGLRQRLLLDVGAQHITAGLSSRAVRNRDHRSWALVAHSPDFIGIADLEMRPIYLNPAGLRLVGLASTSQLADLTIVDFVAREDRARFETLIWPAFLSAGSWSGEISLRHFAGGKDVPVHSEVFVIDEPATDRPLQFATVIRDLRAQKAVEAELRRVNEGLEARIGMRTAELADVNERLRGEMLEHAYANAQLREAQAELIYAFRLSVAAQTAAGFARELSQPLTALTGMIEAAGRLLSTSRPESVELAREAIARASEQVQRANTAVYKIRDFVRYGRIERRLEPVKSIIDEVIPRAVVGPGAADVKVEIEIAAAAAHVLVDRLQIQQILLNLVRNAFEAMGDGDPRELTIRVAAAWPGTLEFAVVDRGAGVPPRIAGQIFEPFVSTKPGRKGLGLSICRSIVEGHGGVIRFEPNPGGGTVFAFTLPIDGGVG